MAEGEQENQVPSVGPADGDPPAPPPPVSHISVPAAPAAGSMPGPPPMPTADRVHAAWQGRADTDYIFDYWTALGWTILTFGIYGFYVFYDSPATSVGGIHHLVKRLGQDASGWRIGGEWWRSRDATSGAGAGVV